MGEGVGPKVPAEYEGAPREKAAREGPLDQVAEHRPNGRCPTQLNVEPRGVGSHFLSDG